MPNRTGNYTAFYVNEPFNDSNLKACSTRDFVTYNLLRAWKGQDTSFPFVDSHDKTYSVRDGSDWETTLKPRLHDRLNKSKNIILILSSITKDSRALHEEIDFGINTNGLPVIVIYPEYSEKRELLDSNAKTFNSNIKKLWDNLPIFRNSMSKVPTIHVPNNKMLIEKVLNDPDFRITTKSSKVGPYLYPL